MDKKYEIYEVNAEIFKCNENYPNTIAFNLQWSANLGFGELAFYYDTVTGKWDYDSECMSKTFCRARQVVK